MYNRSEQQLTIFKEIYKMYFCKHCIFKLIAEFSQDLILKYEDILSGPHEKDILSSFLLR